MTASFSHAARRLACFGALVLAGSVLAQQGSPEPSDVPRTSPPVTLDDPRDRPVSLWAPVTPLERLATSRIPSVDVAAAYAEDELRDARGLPPRFAIAREVEVTPQTDGSWDQLESDMVVWRLRITSRGARSLNFGFTRYHMPEQGRLLIYSADLSERLRAFTAADNEAHGQLWTPPLESDDVVIEAVVPNDAAPSLDLQLGSVNVGYRLFGEVAAAPAGSCNIDVACPDGQLWQEQARSVGLLSIGGTSTCSGVLLNNTAEDYRPYFLTSEHCKVTEQNEASVIVYWNYQNSFCRIPGSPESGAPGNGSRAQFQTGAYLRATWWPVDLTLLELDDNPLPAWNVNFAGWDRSEANPASGVCIHHPRGGEKRISFEFESPYATSYLGLLSPGDGTHWRVTDWDLGTTEPGSSGAPLFDPDHRVVGFLHGGYAECGNDDPDWFTRLASAWDLGPVAATRLQDWLDPLQSGAIAIDTISSDSLSVAPAGDTAHIGRVGGPFTQSEMNYVLRNPTGTPLNYRVRTDHGLLLLNGGTAPVQGTLGANGGSVQVAVRLPNSTASLPPGTYEDTLRFDDLTRGVTRNRRHVIEVGLSLFDTAPTTGYLWGGPRGGPFGGAFVYSLRNLRPTPVTVQVSANQPWISLNGAPGPLVLELPDSDSVDAVAVGFSASANKLPEGSHAATITFTNLSGGGGDTTRQVVLEVGRVIYSSVDTPKDVPDLTTVTSSIDVEQNFCIEDVDVDLDVRHTYVGDLIVELTSPAGTVVRLHNRSGGDHDDIQRTYDSDGTGVAPDGPGNLSDFELESSAGRWTLTVSDTADHDIGVLNGWSLRVAPSVTSCPVPSLIYAWNFDTDPHWTTQGLWSFGEPSGSGSYNSDPSSGFTGQNVYGYNLNGDYQSNLSFAQNLTTGAIDCSNIAGTRLRFHRWLGVEQSRYDKASVQVSRDGINWTAVWSHADPVPIADTAWVLQSFNISRVADGQPAVFIRWGMGPTDDDITYPGWNIDDVQIWGLAPFDDCNRNNLADDDDIDAGRSADCNGNGRPDECDVESGESGDCDRDGVLDECDCSPLRALLPEPHGTIKSRYVSFEPPRVSCPVALRVRIERSTAFEDLDGDTYWVGAPVRVPEPGTPQGAFTAARLQCEPYVADWSSIPILHVYGASVVPSTEYQIQAVRAGCLAGAAPTSGDGYSTPLSVATSRWGDAVAPFGGALQPAFTDVAAVVDRFQGIDSAPMRPVVQLRPDVINPAAPVSFLDVAAELDAFKGVAYPYPIPNGCP